MTTSTATVQNCTLSSNQNYDQNKTKQQQTTTLQIKGIHIGTQEVKIHIFTDDYPIFTKYQRIHKKVVSNK